MTNNTSGLAAAILLLTWASLAVAQSPTIKTPPGWRKETIKLPPAFAREMKWRGVEELRFAPGMFDKTKKDFLTYFMTFRLEGERALTPAEFEREIAAYYQGLSKAVLMSRAPDRKPSKVTVRTKAVSSRAPDDKASDASTAKQVWSESALKWTEPFVTGEAQTLKLKWRSEAKGGATFLWVMASPSDDQEVWKDLEKIAANTKWDK